MELKQIFFGLSGYPSDGKECGRLYFCWLSPALCLVFDTGVAVGAAGSLLYERAAAPDAAPASRSVPEQALRRSEKRERDRWRGLQPL